MFPVAVISIPSNKSSPETNMKYTICNEAFGLNTEKNRKEPRRGQQGPKGTEKGPKRTEKHVLVYYLPKRRPKVGDRQQGSRRGSIWGKY